MILFDPAAMTAPLTMLAGQLRDLNEAPAVLVRAELAGRTAGIASGVRDLGSQAAAAAGQSFEIGSQTKMMTATVVLQLAEEGLIDLDAPVAAYLPAEVVAGLANADQATVRQVLSMRSGIPDYTQATDADGVPLFALPLLEGRPVGPAEELAIARSLAATGAPGEAYAYSNTGYLLLALAVESLAGKAFAEVLHERIFAPLGMADTTADPFAPDPDRLSNYAQLPGDPTPIDVTAAPWFPLGDGEVISTTEDMIRFVRALLVDRTLLGPEAFAEMTAFQPMGPDGGAGLGFGLGLLKVALDDGRVLVGFNGGTLGTETATFLDADSGAIVSVAGTLSGTQSTPGAVALLAGLATDAAWTPVEDDGGPVLVASGSAAEMRIDGHGQGAALDLMLGGASLHLDRDARSLAVADLRFADGSVLVIGDGTADRLADGRGVDVSILRDFGAAARADNHLVGFSGADRLVGGHGDDRIAAGGGDDRLSGRGGNDEIVGAAGADVISGGSGADRLRGGAGDDRIAGDGGADWLAGGAGSDVFLFRAASESAPGAKDRIADFAPGLDRIDLSRIDAGPGAGDDAFRFVGEAGFSGAAGELRVVRQGEGRHLVEADIDGDGGADLALVVVSDGFPAAADFLL